MAADAPVYDRYRVFRYDPADLASMYFPWTEDGIHNPATRKTDATGDYLEVQVDHFSVFVAGGINTSGGGGGCALAPWSKVGPWEFVLPFAAYVLVLAAVSFIDHRRRRAACLRQS